MGTRSIVGLMVVLGVLTGLAPPTHAAEAPDAEQIATDRMPPRLSLADGQVSFWRPGAQDWAQAQVNIALAPGDLLSTGSPGNLEIQVGPRAFVRAWANSQVGLENQEPGFLQFKVTAGTVGFDMRRLEPGQSVEVDTPNAAFTIEHSGYYRVLVTGERTSFITRRGGRATLTPAKGEAVAITPSEEVVVEGTASPQVSSYVAPPRDDWDKWNYTRSDQLLDAVSARYVAPGTYGVDDLDAHGTWRDVPTYGPVWVPTGVQPGWAPYSTGSWTLDPYYGWTWVDTAPWGWAPYHHGRWVYVDRFWAWAPGPVVARPVYAPALVAFFGGAGVRVGIGGSVVGWVPLGWGEPVVPWWGRPGFAHNAWWGGWGGPRVVNNTVISNTTVVNVQNISVYRNTSVQHAVVAVSEDRFGHGSITSARIRQIEAHSLQPIHTGPHVTATPASFVPTANRGFRPPDEVLRRPVVATRPPHAWSESASGGERRVGPAGVPAPAPRLVSVPQQRETDPTLPRPRFGQSTVERPKTDRERSPAPPRPEGSARPERGSGRAPATSRQESPQSPQVPQATTAPPATSQTPARGAAAPPPVARRPDAPPPASPAPAPSQGLAERTPAPPPPGASANRQSLPQPPREPQAATAAPPARRSEAAAPPARPLPGEPANRLSPSRAESRPPQKEEPQAPRPPQDRQQGAPEKASRERGGG